MLTLYIDFEWRKGFVRSIQYVKLSQLGWLGLTYESFLSLRGEVLGLRDINLQYYHVCITSI
jgi:hypothetical protein